MDVLSNGSSSRAIILPILLGLLATSACQRVQDETHPIQPPEAKHIEQARASDSVLTAGLVVLDQVYNTEVVAPYDVFQHTYWEDTTHFVSAFLVSPNGHPVTTAEGVQISAHYSFETTPDIDILIVPSTANSLGADLENDRFLEWLETAAREAEYVISVCNGAFPLSATGLLDGREVTTYPDTRDQLAERFPEITVRQDVRFIQDGKFITSVGGARSYEPALHLVDRLYGTDAARNIAGGLVLPWDRDEIPSAVVQ